MCARDSVEVQEVQMVGKRPAAAPKSEKEQAKAPVQETKAWKAHDEQGIPKNNLPLVFFSLLLATFLVLPTIPCSGFNI